MGNVHSALLPYLVQPAATRSDLSACYSCCLVEPGSHQHLSSLLGSSSGVGPVVPVVAFLHQHLPSVWDRVKPQGLSKELHLIFI